MIKLMIIKIVIVTIIKNKLNKLKKKNNNTY